MTLCYTIQNQPPYSKEQVLATAMIFLHRFYMYQPMNQDFNFFVSVYLVYGDGVWR